MPDPDAARGPDLVQRRFTAPASNRLWVADYTYLRCWEGIVSFSALGLPAAVLSPDEKEPAAMPTERDGPGAALALDEIQGNILPALNKDCMNFLFLDFPHDCQPCAGPPAKTRT